MAVLHVNAVVDEDGNLVIPGAKLPAGSKVAVVTDLDLLEQAVQSGAELTLGPAEDLDLDSSVWLKLAESSMDFWDNPVDDAIWNNA